LFIYVSSCRNREEQFIRRNTLNTHSKVPVDVEKLCKTFASFQCHGVVELVKHLALPENESLLGVHIPLEDIGSVSTEEPVSKETGEGVPCFCLPFNSSAVYVGGRIGDTKVSPLEWLEELSKALDKLPERERDSFNRSCEFVAAVLAAKGEGTPFKE